MAAHSQSKYNLEIELVRKTYWALRQQLKANSCGRQLLPVNAKVKFPSEKVMKE